MEYLALFLIIFSQNLHTKKYHFSEPWEIIAGDEGVDLVDEVLEVVGVDFEGVDLVDEVRVDVGKI